MGNAPVNQLASSKAGCRHEVVGVEASLVPFAYFHIDCAGRSVVFWGGMPAPPPAARQLPPRLLSSAGLINSMELPWPGTFASPTVGQGKPSLYSTSST